MHALKQPYGKQRKTPRDLFPGALEMMVLESLRRQPAHGYALVQHIHQRSNNLLQVEEGSLYPALQRLLKADRFVHNESARPHLQNHQDWLTPLGA